MEDQTVWVRRRYSPHLWWPSWRPDGTRLAVSFARSVSRVTLLDEEGRAADAFAGHRRAINAAAFSPDGKRLATASTDGTLRVWRDDGSATAFEGHAASVESVTWSPDGRLIASASRDKTLRVWRIHDGSGEAVYRDPAVLYRCAFHPHGRWIGVCADRGKVLLLSPEGRLLHALDHPSPVYSIDWSPDGAWIASTSRDGHLRLWNSEGALVQTLPDAGSWLLPAAFHSDGSLVAAGTRDGRVVLWSRGGDLVHTIVRKEPIVALAWRPGKDELFFAVRGGPMELVRLVR